MRGAHDNAWQAGMNRIETLLAAMTLDEKIGQLTMMSADHAVTGPVVDGDVAGAIRAGRTGSLLNLWGAEATRHAQRLAVEETRLGIPLIIGFDILHGQRTIFPIPLAEAALFDPALWERTARAAAVEARQDGVALTFAPMLDVARDPRWGRMAEGPGEDPWVAACFAAAKVRGFQGGDLAAPGSLAATAKHFCGYGAVTAGRDYASVDLSERTLHEVHLPPFVAALRAGVAAVMPAFTDLAGMPMTAHAPLLHGWLRQQQGFDGVVISDYNAIPELMKHGVAGDLAEAAALALKAGVDIDMMGAAYARGLPAALARGLVGQDAIDTAVRRVLTLKERLGLFADPYRPGPPDGPFDATDRHRLAREVARRAIVLLTNPHGILPLAATVRRVAVVGPLADAAAEMLGPWAGAGGGTEPVSILAGVAAGLPQCEVVFARGVDLAGDDTAGIAEARELCRSADVTLLCVGEAAAMSGEAASRAHPGLPGRQRELAEALLGVGEPVVAVLSCGRPLLVPWLVERAAAVLVTWFLGSEAGHAVADLLTPSFSPTGRLPVTWPRDIGQVPIFYAQRPGGRPAGSDEHYASRYLDMPAEPLFPFGHGLSYSRFTLHDLRASPAQGRAGEAFEITVDVSNDGAEAGEETLFLFARARAASVARPVLELKDVGKLALAAGERGTWRWTLPVSALAFLGQDLQPVIEPGDVDILVGPSADEARLLRTTVRVVAP